MYDCTIIADYALVIFFVRLVGCYIKLDLLRLIKNVTPAHSLQTISNHTDVSH